MADSSKRPMLHVVRHDETAASSPAPTSTVTPEVSPKQSTAFADAVGSVDATNPLQAAMLVCVGAQVADDTLAIYRQAADHAPAGTFRRNVPPGLRSAEATKAWVETHLNAIRKKAESENPTEPYDRADELKQAVAFTGSELDRALSAAIVAGLKFEGRHSNILTDVLGAVDRISSTPKTVALEPESSNDVLVPSETMFEMYLMGTDVLLG